jgi:inhibitor of KinA sporulation pathway (predicted exonuclease)
MKRLGLITTALYLDLEMNCSDELQPSLNKSDPEIIEIGICRLDVPSLRIAHETNYLVRPLHLDISLRCTAITGLTTGDLKSAPSFKDVLASIRRDWPANATCFAWGKDGDILERACRKHHLNMPFRHFLDLSQIVRSALLLEQQPGVKSAMELLGLSTDGGAHMAVIDARNTARIHAELIRRYRAEKTTNAPIDQNRSSKSPTWFGELLEKSLGALSSPSADGSKTHINIDQLSGRSQ